MANPVAQSVIIGLVVYGAIMTIKPSFVYDASTGMLKNKMYSPMNLGVAAGAFWAAYQIVILKKSMTATDSGNMADGLGQAVSNASTTSSTFFE
jgi:hypothetical protein